MSGRDDLSTACRVDVLNAYGILDTPREREFDEIAVLAAQICETPVALVSLVDAGRQWFKAEVGFGVRETTLDQSICAHAIAGSELLEIRDTTLDPRTAGNPLVTGEAHVRFYAGAVLTSPTGIAYGTLCVLDRVPRELTDMQRSALTILARQVMKELDLRLALRRQTFLQREMDHRVKNSLQSVASFVRVQAGASQNEETRDILTTVGRRISSVALLHQELYSSSIGENVALDSYMGKLAGLFAAAAPEGVAVEVTFEAVIVTSEQASALAAVANEFATNSFKYAFPDGRRGTVSIVGRSDGDGLVTVTMKDDGVGVTSGTKPRGLGIRIIEASAQQMGAACAFDTQGPGFGLTLEFPIMRPHSAFELSREAVLSAMPANDPPVPLASATRGR